MPSRPFPHTRAQLSAIARQYKPLPGDGHDGEADDDSRVSSEFVEQIVSLLVDEREDELKAVLKATYGMDDEMVGGLRGMEDMLLTVCRWSRACWT
ncbi:hypothetical protein FB451DRAFT_1269589 [Mycena latifolia]|nr:hypothetical protein FB451DRAFT_1269589 [Mycena latifolia]